MDSNLFYNSIDRIMPRCLFCLEDRLWDFMNEEPYNESAQLKKDCYCLSKNIAIIPITTAVRKIFISCISEKYEYILINKMSKYVYCITPSLRNFLCRYSQPRHISDISSINKSFVFRQFFYKSLSLGLLEISGDSHCIIFSKCVNLKLKYLQNIFNEVILLRKRRSSLSFLVKDISGKKAFVKQFLDSCIITRENFNNKMIVISKFHRYKPFCKVIQYNVDQMFYIMEYIEGDNLEEKYLKLPIRTKINIINQIVKSVAILHSKNIIHGDLHLGQFIISGDGIIKMIDYDMVADVSDNDSLYHMGATCEYIEPESISRNPFVMIGKQDLSFQAEIYRLGVLIYNLIYGIPPFLELTWKMLYKSKKKNNIQFGNRDNNGYLVPKRLIYIMKRCLSKSPEKRFFSAQEIISYLIHK